MHPGWQAISPAADARFLSHNGSLVHRMFAGADCFQRLAFFPVMAGWCTLQTKAGLSGEQQKAQQKAPAADQGPGFGRGCCKYQPQPAGKLSSERPQREDHPDHHQVMGNMAVRCRRPRQCAASLTTHLSGHGPMQKGRIAPPLIILAKGLFLLALLAEGNRDPGRLGRGIAAGIRRLIGDAINTACPAS